MASTLARAVPDAIDPGMHANQRARADPPLDLVVRDPRGEQLRARDHPMRSGRQLGDLRLYRGRLVSHWPHLATTLRGFAPAQPVKWGRGLRTTTIVAAAVLPRRLSARVAVFVATTLRKRPDACAGGR